MRARRAEGGQATVELVAVIPLAVAVLVAVVHVLAVAAAREAAGAAAHAGAVAVLQEGDPRRAARAALGDRAGSVRVSGRRVTVRVVPGGPVRALARRLAVTATADAGAP